MDDITTVCGLSSTACIAGVVTRVESLPLVSLGDFVRGRMGESTRQVEGLFESLLAQSFDDTQRE
jgi:hypothetical protein